MPVVDTAPAEALAPRQKNEPEIAWHARPASEVLAAFETGRHGLSAEETIARKARFGPNRLPAARARSAILRFL